MVTIRTVSLPLIFLQIDLWHLPSAPYGIILHRRCTSSPSVIVTDRRQKRLVFQVCTTKMNPSEEADLEDYVSRPDKISAAEGRTDARTEQIDQLDNGVACCLIGLPPCNGVLPQSPMHTKSF
ncbi:hypothetical protein LINPERPRIM_LOCUS38180 [Linum perenne]